MKLTSFCYSMLALVFFAACSGGAQKKVVVMSSGKIKVDYNAKTITLEPGTQHNEAELILGSGDKGVTVKSPAGDKTYDAPDAGLYLLNLKTDTLIGNLVNFGSGGSPTSISTEELEHIVDSTQQLIEGKNASDEHKTYFLLPNSIKKITTNTTAQVLNPYKAIPYKVEADKNGNIPEIYKLSTVEEKRESLNDLKKRMNIK